MRIEVAPGVKGSRAVNDSLIEGSVQACFCLWQWLSTRVNLGCQASTGQGAKPRDEYYRHLQASSG